MSSDNRRLLAGAQAIGRKQLEIGQDIALLWVIVDPVAHFASAHQFGSAETLLEHSLNCGSLLRLSNVSLPLIRKDICQSYSEAVCGDQLPFIAIEPHPVTLAASIKSEGSVAHDPVARQNVFAVRAAAKLDRRLRSSSVRRQTALRSGRSTAPPRVVLKAYPIPRARSAAIAVQASRDLANGQV